MSEKRKDKKGRILRTGESQRSDGRYAYTYTDNNSKRRTVYSWRLEPTDRIPSGRKDEQCLRDKIKQINKNRQDLINVDADKITVLQMLDRYLATKHNLRSRTRESYNSYRAIVEKDPIAERYISKLTASDLKLWIVKLHNDGYSFNTIMDIKSLIGQMLYMAVHDNILRFNPCEFPLKSVIADDTEPKVILTKAQEESLYDFMRNNGYHNKVDAVYILFHTGLRISEFCGLTIKDIDFVNHQICVDKQLLKSLDMKYSVEPPKTKNGVRYVPMSPDVEDCFRRIIKAKKEKHYKIEPIIDGVSGFLFFSQKSGMPFAASHWQKTFRNCWKRYNKLNDVPLPKVTPHVCRHTFCSNMAKQGMNANMLKYIMGHGSITVTLDYYTHLDAIEANKEMGRVMGY